MDKYKGKINELNKLILSDPHYKKDVWCRYQKNFRKNDDWNIEIAIEDKDSVEVYEGEEYRIQGVAFNVLLKNNKYQRLSDVVSINDTDTIDYNPGVSVKTTTVGMDSAQVAIGANENANIIENFSKYVNSGKLSPTEQIDLWHPEFSLKTGTDGMFGEVNEFSYENITFAISFNGWLDIDTDYSVESVLKYLEKQLNIKDLTKELETNNMIEK